MDLFVKSKVLLLFAYLGVSLSQPDCSGVDCPPLDNCIDEVLESGSCCASCLQQGCMCEGYQYYDCISAGFKNGKVPEGDSYFVDYGSTECSCPRGGGRISCSFISCPDMPPNCIKVSEPIDGCIQCQSVGCVQGSKKYKAGQSVNVDPCRVCHCPNEGGKLMCYTAPECEPNEDHDGMLTTHKDELTTTGQYLDHFPLLHHLSPEANLPLFSAAFPDKEQPEDYEYGLTDFPETYPEPLAFPTKSSSDEDSLGKLQSFVGQGKLELKEQYASQEHSANGEGVTAKPLNSYHSSVSPLSVDDGNPFKGIENVKFLTETESPLIPNKPSDDVVPMNAPHLTSEGPVHQDSTLELQIHPRTNFTDAATNESPSTRLPVTDINEQSESHGHIFPPPTLSSAETTSSSHQTTSGTVTPRMNPKEKSNNINNVNETVEDELNNGSQEGKSLDETMAKTSAEPTRAFSDQYSTTSEEGLVPTSEPTAERIAIQDVHHPRPDEEDQEDLPVFLVNSSQGPIPSSDELLQSCCSAGRRWAAEFNHCSHMALLDNETFAVCSVAQEQCCLSSLRESQCEAGVMSAKGGDTCGQVNGQDCADDSRQVCCSCCALGMRVRRSGQGCDFHQYLSYPCGHVFLTCCEDLEAPSLFPLRTKQGVKPTAKPRRVFDVKFPKEAFSISDDATNKLEEQEDVDECQLYSGQLCQHTCTNIWGSYLCSCHPGYILQQDGHSCAPVSPDKDHEMVLVRPIDTHTTTAATATTTTPQPVMTDPCADNAGCSQQCRAESGRARCSCFPGFSLMPDGRRCQDVDECTEHTHSCRSDESCLNMVGSFVCELQVHCPAGYQLTNTVCEDIDECVQRTHNCGLGSVCENTDGSFMCISKQKCMSGFTRDHLGNCVDINECSSSINPCSPGSNCVNTVGSFSCQQKVISCSHGHRANAGGDKCVDVDECQTGAHHCGVGQVCHNMPGSYRCDCQVGYQYDNLRKVCTDINECWRYSGRLCGQTCENTPGSYYCSCTAGFSLASDGKNCEDVNECQNNPCGQECANIYGSYQCYCRQGYYLKENGHTCEDIDECSQAATNLCAFQCVNVAGSYHCACPAHGYSLSANRRTCKDIDECTTGHHNCSSGQTCYNLQGGYRCLSFNCPYNYQKVADTRCERVSCPGNSLDCQNSPVRITYYQLTFQSNIIVPAQIFRIGPSPVYSGDHVVLSILKGNEEGYFSTRNLNTFTGAVYLQRQVRQPKDFLLDVEMKLLRQGAVTRFLTKIYVFITAGAL